MTLQSLIEQAIGLYRDGRLEEAAELCGRVLAQGPDFTALHLLGVIRMSQGDYAQAARLTGEAVALNPADAVAQASHGAALQAMGMLRQAAAHYDRSLALRPDDPFTLHGRALVRTDLEDNQAALADLDRALALAPGQPGVWVSRGIVLHAMTRDDEALESFSRALALQPDHALARFNRGVVLLSQGKLEEGLPLFEARLAVPRPDVSRQFATPAWNGKDDIKGRTLFVYVEQGLGDTIHFSRFATLAAAQGARVLLSVQDSLVRLLKGLQGVEVIGSRDPAPGFDHHISLTSLAWALGTRLETIPATVPYLKPEPERVEFWRNRIGSEGLRIGISWQGDKFRKPDIGRSFPLAGLAPLSGIPGVRLISLQKKEGVEQIESLPDMRVERLGADFDQGPDAFLDSAAVMASLDLMVAPDTALAHLAGALARPVWIALKHVPDWRWFQRRPDSAWYPTARLFRQNEPGQWQPVFAAMAAALEGKLPRHSSFGEPGA